MQVRLRRGVTLAAVGSLALALAGVATTTAPAADAATCRVASSLLSRAPIGTYAIPGGASARIWDTGNLASDLSEVRIVAVTIPTGTLTPSVATAPTISLAATPSTMVARDLRAVVVINGGHFNAAVPGIPLKSQIFNSTIRKAIRSTSQNVVVYSGTKAVSLASNYLTGTVRTTRGTWPLAAVNWETLPSAGVSVHTYAWGSRAHPVGSRTVVVSGGKVIKVFVGSAGARRPTTSQTFLTAPAGTYATALARLRVGDAVTVVSGTGGTWFNDGKWPHTPIGKPTGMVGAGGTLVLNGANMASCIARDEQLRPRSAIAWKANGDIMVVTASGRALVNGTRFGGATVHQFADYLRRLGAVKAVNLDGGTSTTLLVRLRVGGPLIRLDRGAGEYQRAVVDAISFRAL